MMQKNKKQIQCDGEISTTQARNMRLTITDIV